MDQGALDEHVVLEEIELEHDLSLVEHATADHGVAMLGVAALEREGVAGGQEGELPFEAADDLGVADQLVFGRGANADRGFGGRGGIAGGGPDGDGSCGDGRWRTGGDHGWFSLSPGLRL